MYAAKKLFNYLTIVLAVATIISCFIAWHNNQRSYISLILLILTFILNLISRSLNDKDLNLTKDDKEMLEKLNKDKKQN